MGEDRVWRKTERNLTFGLRWGKDFGLFLRCHVVKCFSQISILSPGAINFPFSRFQIPKTDLHIEKESQSCTPQLLLPTMDNVYGAGPRIPAVPLLLMGRAVSRSCYRHPSLGQDLISTVGLDLICVTHTCSPRGENPQQIMHLIIWKDLRTHFFGKSGYYY